MGQLLIISDPRPLDKQLGKKFFRNAPKRPGVYLMRDAQENVLYVGKAKNLQQRIRNYRIANPDKMPRRHLKMLRQVARIEFQYCPNETAALKLESKLIRLLKPRFNRAGVWPGKTNFIVWQIIEDRLELAVTDVPRPTWKRFGPFGSSAYDLHQSLAKMLWLVLNPNRSVAELPLGWIQGNHAQMLTIHCGQFATEIATQLEVFFWKSSDEFILWLGAKFSSRTHAFERTVIGAELERLKDFSTKRIPVSTNGAQLALL